MHLPAAHARRAPLRLALWLFTLALGITWGLALSTRAEAAAPSWRIEPAPAWRTPIPMPEEAAVGADDPNSNGSRYLIFDRQARVGERSLDTYSHIVRKITNEAGLQAASQVSIDFDPTFQTLLLHSVVLRRGSEVENRLIPDAIKVVQREPMLEAQVYDGRQSAILFLSDVRVGDVIEYAYTLRGADPTLGGHYSDAILLGGPQAIERLYARVVLSRGRHVNIALHGRGADAAEIPAPQTRGEFTEYAWDRRNVPALAAESDTPSWYDAFPWAQVSDFDSWEEVAALATRLFRVDLPPSGALRDWVASTRRESASPDAFLMRAIRFVQDEVRYVAIEVGVARRRPTDPATVFARRYGDCKDKATLLVAILRMGGLQASPALVSTTHGHVLDVWTPTTSAFDHAIVRVTSNDKTVYWVDATLALQGGGLARLTVSPFERALTLDPRTKSLEALQPPFVETASPRIRDHFDVAAPGSSDETRLDSERVYEGIIADGMRGAFRASTLEESQKDFLGAYAQDFRGIHETAPLEMSDDRERNIVRVLAHFAIPHFWERDEKNGQYTSATFARSIDRFFPRPREADRHAPVALVYPFRTQYAMAFDLPFDLTINPDDVEARTSALDFAFASACVSKRHLTYTYDFATFQDSLPKEEWASHVAELDRARATLGRTLTYTAPMADGFNWAVFMAVLGCAPFLVWGTLRAYRYEAAPKVDGDEIYGPVGLGGWLILLGINISTSTLMFANAVVSQAKSAFSLSLWNALTTPGIATYNPALGVLIPVEWLVQLALFAEGAIVVVLFVRKRRSFPAHFTAFALAIVTFAIFDHAAVSVVSSQALDAERMGERAGGFLRSVLSAAIWVSYVRRSRRVKATFVRPRSGNRVSLPPSIGVPEMHVENDDRRS